MFTKFGEMNHFIPSPIRLIENETNQKTLCIPIKKSKYSYNNDMYNKSENYSKSWNGTSFDTIKNKKKINSYSSSNYNFHEMIIYDDFDKINKLMNNDLKPYNAINNCKSAGIIPYTLHNNMVYFLFQKTINPIKRKDFGWNDFGGKRNILNENTAEAAAREFSEETSCLFYLQEKTSNKTSNNSTNDNNMNDKQYKEIYKKLKHNDVLYYDEETINLLRKLIPESQKYYVDKITEFVVPIYASSKETYITYFVKVDYIPSDDIPRAEDIHIDYEERYMRNCRWFSYNEIVNLAEKEFHKRLQITRVQQRIINYYEKGLFI